MCLIELACLGVCFQDEICMSGCVMKLSVQCAQHESNVKCHLDYCSTCLAWPLQVNLNKMFLVDMCDTDSPNAFAFHIQNQIIAANYPHESTSERI